jgi:hypothetical protein
MRPTVVVALLAFAVASAAAAADALVTMEGRIVREPNMQAQSVRLSGTVPSPRAGERIEILAKECLSAYYRQVAGTQTVAGGQWQAEVPLSSASAIVARWRGRRSAPFKATPRIEVFLAHDEGTRRWTAGVSSFLTPANFSRRVVELQRLGPAGWVRVRRARLRRAVFASYSTTFFIPTRGLTMRVLVPDRTARPCFRASTSEIFRS